MPEISVKVGISCSCGKDLCGQSTGGNDFRGQPIITVEPCEKCLEKACNESHNTGYDKGLEDGLNA